MPPSECANHWKERDDMKKFAKPLMNTPWIRSFMKILSILSTDKEVPFLIVVTRYYLGYKSKELNAIDEEDNNG